MSRYRAYIFGGSSYAAPSFDDKPDFTFASLAEARRAMDRVPHDPCFPCVSDIPPDDGGPEMYLFRVGNDSDMPDFMLTFGPRGGVKVERL